MKTLKRLSLTAALALVFLFSAPKPAAAQELGQSYCDPNYQTCIEPQLNGCVMSLLQDDNDGLFWLFGNWAPFIMNYFGGNPGAFMIAMASWGWYF